MNNIQTGKPKYKTLKPCFSMPNRMWLLVGRPQSGRWVLPKWLWYTMELNGNKNWRAFYALSV